MNLNEDIKRIKEVMGIRIITEGSDQIGDFTVDLENGPSNHRKRPLGNWPSDNAWDLFAPAGTVVNSYTDGTVSKVFNNGKRSGSVYGTQVTIKGDGNYPDIFYTHLKNVKLEQGQQIKVGDYVGEVSEWCKTESCVDYHSGSHVHIGLPYGKHLKDLLGNSEAIFSGIKKPEPGTKKIDSSYSDMLYNKIIGKALGV